MVGLVALVVERKVNIRRFEDIAQRFPKKLSNDSLLTLVKKAFSVMFWCRFSSDVLTNLDDGETQV